MRKQENRPDARHGFDWQSQELAQPSAVIVALNCAVGIPYKTIERPAISQF
jgi:hypothetical protein